MLKDIRRQKQLWARRAAKLFAGGRVGPALAAFARKNCITVRDDLDETIRQACLDWTAEGLLTPHRTLILANTNDITHQVNQICQEHRLRAGVLQADHSIRITDEQEDAVYESRLHVHDRVLFTKNSHGSKGYGVDNGSLGTVTAINPNPFAREISVALDNGRHVRINVRKYPHLRLGYSATTYRAQGASISKVHAIVGGSFQSLPASYVQATRGVEETHFYTTAECVNESLEDVAKSPLAQQMARRPDLRLAVDLLESAPMDLRPREPRIRRRGKSRGQRTPQRPSSGSQPKPISERPAAEVSHRTAQTVEEPSVNQTELGYHPLRIASGSYTVFHGKELQVSCLGGGAAAQRNRLPPPAGYPMPYASDSIRVQRLEPVASRAYTLAEAARAGLLEIVGTGYQDHVQVLCSPGERWILTVGDSLGLVSAQDDIRLSRALYAHPSILRELERLDRVQIGLTQILPPNCLLLSLFSCLRRQASWLLPHADEPATLTRELLRRFCRLLFEDAAAREHLHWFQNQHAPVLETGAALFLNQAARSLVHRPPPPLLETLARAIARQESIEEPYNACVAAVASRFPARPSDADLARAMAPLDGLIAKAQAFFRLQRWNPFEEIAAMQLLYDAAETPIPEGAVFQPVFKHTIQLLIPRMQQFFPALRLCHYVSAFVEGRDEDVQKMGRMLREALAEARRESVGE